MADYAEQAMAAFKAGDVQQACNIISLSAYHTNLGKFWSGIMEEFRGQGITPGNPTA